MTPIVHYATLLKMTELINPAIIGVLTGLVSGCIPGIGNFASLIIIFPYLIVYFFKFTRILPYKIYFYIWNKIGKF